MSRRGFTLIELLVVIAIIGILSAVVLASLNTARSKGNDAAIKSNLDTIRTQSAIFYDSNNGWSNGGAAAITGTGTLTTPTTAMCNALTANMEIFNDTSVVKAIQSADKAAGGNSNPTGPTQAATAKVLCVMDAAASGAKPTLWAVTGPLNATGAGWWCVDSTGNAKQESGSTLSAAGACL